MKKLVISIVSICFIVTGLFSTGAHATPLSTASSSNIEPFSITRTFSYEKYYHKTEDIPTILYYADQYGWYGNLRLKNVIPDFWDKMYVIALYEGTLTCPTGNCPSPSSLEIQEP